MRSRRPAPAAACRPGAVRQTQFGWKCVFWRLGWSFETQFEAKCVFCGALGMTGGVADRRGYRAARATGRTGASYAAVGEAAPRRECQRKKRVRETRKVPQPSQGVKAAGRPKPVLSMQMKVRQTAVMKQAGRSVTR